MKEVAYYDTPAEIYHYSAVLCGAFWPLSAHCFGFTA